LATLDIEYSWFICYYNLSLRLVSGAYVLRGRRKKTGLVYYASPTRRCMLYHGPTASQYVTKGCVHKRGVCRRSQACAARRGCRRRRRRRRSRRTRLEQGGGARSAGTVDIQQPPWGTWLFFFECYSAFSIVTTALRPLRPKLNLRRRNERLDQLDVKHDS
jgi:hypothetical protein